MAFPLECHNQWNEAKKHILIKQDVPKLNYRYFFDEKTQLTISLLYPSLWYLFLDDPNIKTGQFKVF